MAVLLAVLLLWSLAGTSGKSSSRPHIVIILADDLGWNDVSFHGSDQIPTPNIDALAYNGVILNSHYVPALCTPSRASLLTGKYPTTLGMQHMVILAQEPWGLPLEETLMSEHLRRNGYSTHAIGKWHLGFHRKSYTPLRRGFDTFFGYYNGYQDYYDHTMEASDQDVAQRGYDMRRGLDVDYTSIGKYSTDAYTDEAVEIIQNHNSSQGPMFLYLAHLAPHTGNSDNPYQAPDEEIAKFNYIKDPERRVYAAMVSKLDQGVGKVMTALRKTQMLDNSIVLFMSDNGAVTFGVHSNHGSNFPLRGLKESPWEGGVRGVAALWTPLLNQTRRISNQLMHTSDWLPTLFHAAGLEKSELGDIDGIDMWAALSNNLESPRKEVFNNYDEIEDYSSLRIGPWKYISGTAQGGEVDDWYGESGEEDSPPAYNLMDVLHSETSIALSGFITEQQLKSYSLNGHYTHQLLTPKEALYLRRSSILHCGKDRKEPMAMLSPSPSHHYKNLMIQEIEDKIFQIQNKYSPSRHLKHNFTSLGEFSCDPRKMLCLFNLEEDPCEELNLAHLFPDVVMDMEERLKILKKSVRRPLNQPGDPLADPNLYNGTWTHWCDPENEPTPHLSLYFMPLYSNQEIWTISIFDNIILKVLTVPILFVLSTILQPFVTIIQSFIMTLAVIMFLVTSLLITDYFRSGFKT